MCIERWLGFQMLACGFCIFGFAEEGMGDGMGGDGRGKEGLVCYLGDGCGFGG